MLNLFLRDAGDSTQEERDMVDEVEYKLLHPDLGDTVQDNKTSFGNGITGSVLLIIFQDKQSTKGNTNETSNELQ